MIDIAVALRVEEHLDLTNYEVEPGYVPSMFALEFVTFIKLINGDEGEENQTPLVHYYMLDTLIQGKKRIINMCHRGMAKTAVMGEYLFLYLGVYGKLPGFGKVTVALYVSDSIENGVKNMRRNLEYRWTRSDFLQKYIPTTNFTDVRWEFINADGNHFVVNGYGAKTGVRGKKEYGTRPQLAVLDDIVSDEDARSPVVISSIEDTIYKAVNYALHTKNNMIIWSGTPFNAKDPLYKAVESGAWTVNVFPVCEQFPCTKKDFRGSWEDRFPYSYVKEEYERALMSGKISTFNQELMLRIMSEEDRLILDSDIMWYKQVNLIANRSSYNFYITTDLATSERTSADFSFISVWAINSEGDWFWVDGVCARQTMDKNINDVFRLTQMYKPQQVGFEVSGQQEGFISWIQDQMLVRKIFFNLASDKNGNKPGIRPTTNKMQRFNIMVPNFKAHKMFFPLEVRHQPAMLEAQDEMRLISVGGIKSKHDDFLDTVSMLSSLTPWKPSTADPLKINDNGYWESDMENDILGIQSYTV